MRRLDVDLLDRPDPVRRAGWAAVLVGAACLALAAWHAQVQHGRLAREAATNAQLRERLDQLHARRAATEKEAVNPFARQDEELARLAAFDLDGVFASAESAQVSGVRALSIEMSPADGSARLQVEASAVPSVLDYVDALNAGLPTPAWRIARVDGAGSGAGGGTRAQVEGHWRHEADR